MGIWFVLLWSCQERVVSVADSPDPSTMQMQRAKRKGFLGVTLEMSSLEEAKEHGYDRPLIWIRMVAAESAAASAGLLQNDLIVAADAKEFQRVEDFVSYIQSKSAGETIVLKRVSNSTEDEVTVMLGARPNEANLVRTMFLKKAAPSFAYRTFQGNEQKTLSDHKGKVVLLDFWATWCGPCLMSIPSLNRLQEQYRDKGLVVLGVTDEGSSKIQGVARRYKMAYPIGIDSEREAFQAYFVSSLPTAFLIDKDGVIQEIFVGAGHTRALESKIEDLLAQQR